MSVECRFHSTVIEGGPARHADAIIRAVVVFGIAEKDGWDRADAAHVGRIILTRACIPRVRGFNMDLPARVVISEEAAGQDWHWVALVVNVRDVAHHQCVNIIRPGLVANAREPVHDGPDGDANRQLQSEVYAIEQRECCAEGVPHGCHGRGTGRIDHVLDGRQDL